MAESEDEGFPPETQKSPAEFGFRELCNLKMVISNQQPAYESLRSNLVVVANKFGHIFLGTPDGVKVFSSIAVLDAGKKGETEIGSPVAVISLRNSPNWLGLSSDNLTFSVCCRTEKGPQILFFDIRNILNQAKSTKTPFHSLFLSKTSSAYVTSLRWNPSQEFADLLAICLSTGSFHLLSVENSATEIAVRPDDFGASTVCWSPKGKQMIIGKNDGTLCQFTQKMEVRRTVSVSNVIDRSVKTCDILWLSTYHVAAAYVASDDNSFTQPNLFLADMPSKNEQRDVIWKNYEDPCFGMNESREPQYSFTFLDQWQMFISLSSNSTDIAVIGKNWDSQIWEIWNLDDSSRAALPISEFTEDDSVPIGADVITTAQDRIVLGDAKDCGPMPILAILTNDGVLCMYNMINLMEGYPDLVRPRETLDSSGERPAVRINIQASGGSGDVGKPLVPSMKQKLSAKQSLPPPSTPTAGYPLNGKSDSAQLPPKGLKPQFATSTPVVGKLPPFSEGPSMIQQLTQQRLQTKQPLMREPVVETPDTVTKNKGTLLTTFDPDQSLISARDSKPRLPQPALTKQQASQVPQQNSRSVVKNTSTAAGVKVSTHSEKSYSAPLMSKNDTVVGQTRMTKPKVENSTKQSSKPHKTSFMPMAGKDVTADLKTAFEDITNFDVELNSINSLAQSEMENMLRQLAGSTGKKDSLKKLENLRLFSDEIKRTTEELNGEIQDASTSLLSLISNAEEFSRRRNSVYDGSYKALLYSRPLEQSKRRKLEVVRGLYQYVVNSVRDSNAALDAKWENYLGKRAGNREGEKRGLRVGDWEEAYQGLVNNMRILHRQEMKIMLLSQQLDRLHLERSSQQSSSILRRSSEVNASGDLQLLADSLLLRKPGEETKPSIALEGVGLSTRQKLSPKKQVQLGQMLAKRRVAPVRVSSNTTSGIVAKTTHRVRREVNVPSSASESISSPVEVTSESSSAKSTSPSGESSPECYGFDAPLHQQGHSFHSSAESIGTNVPVFSSAPTAPIRNSGLQKFSMIPQGSATLAYGAPKSATAETRRREIPALSTYDVEATSNLNNPPQVVNIQKFDPTPTDESFFPEKFEPKPEVPEGAAKVVQNVLNFVKAEKEQHQPKDWGHLQDGNQPAFALRPSADLQSRELQSTAVFVETRAQPSFAVSKQSAVSLPSVSLPSKSSAQSAAPQKLVFPTTIVQPVLPSAREGEKPKKGVSKSASMPLVTAAPVSTIATRSLASSMAMASATKPVVSSLSSVTASGSLPELFKLRSDLSFQPQLPPLSQSLIKQPFTAMPPNGDPPKTVHSLASKTGVTMTSSVFASVPSVTESYGISPPVLKETGIEGSSSSENPAPRSVEAELYIGATTKSTAILLTQTSDVSASQGAPSVLDPGSNEAKASSSTGNTSAESVPSVFGKSISTAPSAASKLEPLSTFTASNNNSVSSGNASSLLHGSNAPPTSDGSLKTLFSTSEVSVAPQSSSSASVISASTLVSKVEPGNPVFGFKAASTSFQTAASQSATLSGSSSAPFQSPQLFGKLEVSSSESAVNSKPYGKPEPKPLETVSASSPFQSSQLFGKSETEPTESVTSSSLFQTSQLFGKPETKPSGSTFGSSPFQNSQLFGNSQNKPAESASASSPFQSSRLFGEDQKKPSESVFGSLSMSSPFQSNQIFGKPETKPLEASLGSTPPPGSQDGGVPSNKSVFGNSGTLGSGSQQTVFGSGAPVPKHESAGFSSFTTPASNSKSSVFGSFGFSGLGGKPSEGAAKVNPFQTTMATGDEGNSSALFGSAGAKSFGQASAFGQGFESSAFSSAVGGVASQGFGGFNKTQQSVFGAAPAFGSPPSFGASASNTFGSGFGVQSQHPGSFDQIKSESGGFASFARNDAPGFGSIAGGSSFGMSSAPAFGSNPFNNQNQKAPSFTGWR